MATMAIKAMAAKDQKYNDIDAIGVAVLVFLPRDGRFSHSSVKD
jgi:hypothetical protein